MTEYNLMVQNSDLELPGPEYEFQFPYLLGMETIVPIPKGALWMDVLTQGFQL